MAQLPPHGQGGTEKSVGFQWWLCLGFKDFCSNQGLKESAVLSLNCSICQLHTSDFSTSPWGQRALLAPSAAAAGCPCLKQPRSSAEWDQASPAGSRMWGHLIHTCCMAARQPDQPPSADKSILRQFYSPLHHQTLSQGVVEALQAGQGPGEPGWVSWSEQPCISQEQDGLINDFRL